VITQLCLGVAPTLDVAPPLGVVLSLGVAPPLARGVDKRDLGVEVWEDELLLLR